MVAIDPVCGTEIADEASARWHSRYEGQNYFFCCKGCKEAFDSNAASVFKPLRQHKAVITSRVDLTDELWQIRLRTDAPLAFQPGQYVVLVHAELPHTCCFSIVSAPHEGDLELFLELVPGGVLTPVLHGQGPGDVVDVRHAGGQFVLAPEYADHIMVATVCGIAPYVGMLRDFLQQQRRGHRFFVLHGASYMDELGYHDEIAEMAREYPETIRYLPTVSRAEDERNQAWRGRTGRVDRLLTDALRDWGVEPTTTLVYACGHAGMVEEVKRQVTPLGFTVREESWWGS